MKRDHVSRPLIPICIGMIAGIVVGDRWPGREAFVMVLTGISLLSIFYSLHRRRKAIVFPLLFILTVGYLCIQPWRHPRYPENHVIHFADRIPRTVFGTLLEIGDTQNQRTRTIFQVRQMEAGGRRFDVTGEIRLTIIGDRPPIVTGSRISFYGKIKRIRNFNNPGGFDYQRYMSFQKIAATSYTTVHRLQLLNPGETAGKQVLENLRHTLSRAIDRAVPGDSAGILKALVLGRRGDISAETKEVFHRTGTGHLLAISGLHLGVIASGAFFVFSFVFSYFPPLLWRGWKDRAAAVAAIFPVMGYGMMAGLTPGTQRAMVMVTVFLLTYLVGRERDGLNSLAAAAISLILIHPPCVFSISFQLSFAAVSVILIGTGRRSKKNEIRREHQRRMIQKTVAFLSITLLATLGTTPIVMYYFNRLSLIGPLANCFAVPLIGAAVVPLGLLSCAVMPVSDFLAGVGFHSAGILLDSTIAVLAWMSDLPYASWRTFSPSILEIVLVYGFFCSFVMPSGRKQKAAPAPNRRVPRCSVPYITICGLTAVLLMDAGYWIYERNFRKELRVTILDVGQGSAALVELPGGKEILIDGGGFPDNDIFDVGERIVAPFLWRKKICSIEAMVLSHANSDHLNGLIFIADQFQIGEVWSNGEGAETDAYRRFRQVLQRRRIPMRRLDERPNEDFDADTEITLLNPPEDFLLEKQSQPWRCLNNNSLVLRIGYGRHSFLFSGDIKSRAELEMVYRHNEKMHSTVLVSPHHGSRYSSTEDFLRCVSPEIVVVSCGFHNRFGFPHAEVLHRYRRQKARVYRTDRMGAVTFVSDGRELVMDFELRGTNRKVDA